jgi:hypothetical protein
MDSKFYAFIFQLCSLHSENRDFVSGSQCFIFSGLEAKAIVLLLTKIPEHKHKRICMNPPINLSCQIQSFFGKPSGFLKKSVVLAIFSPCFPPPPLSGSALKRARYSYCTVSSILFNGTNLTTGFDYSV